MTKDKYLNKYRTSSIRLQNWDYKWAGIYFVTICTAKRVHSLGNIDNKEMHLSPIGVIADVLWHELKKHFDNIQLGAFVVMPNHIHGIIAIDTSECSSENSSDTNKGTDNACVVSTGQIIGQKRFQHQGSHTLSSIVGSYKSAVSKHAHRMGMDFAWHSGYYENIIRNNHSLSTVEKYIDENIQKWDDDKFNNYNSNKPTK